MSREAPFVILREPLLLQKDMQCIREIADCGLFLDPDGSRYFRLHPVSFWMQSLVFARHFLVVGSLGHVAQAESQDRVIFLNLLVPIVCLDFSSHLCSSREV